MCIDEIGAFALAATVVFLNRRMPRSSRPLFGWGTSSNGCAQSGVMGRERGRSLDGMTSSLEWSSMVMMEAFLAGDISIDSPCEPMRFGAMNTMCVLMVLAQGARQGR